MPLNLDGQLTLSSAPTVGSSGLKRAMLVRLTEDSLDALSADLAAGKYPQVQFEFGAAPGITIGDQLFPVRASAENAPHELYIRKIDASRPSAPTALRIFGTVTGSFQVQRTEVSRRAQEKLRDRTLLAEQEKQQRHTIFLDSPDALVAAAGKKRKLPATPALGSNAPNRPGTSKDSRHQLPSTSTPLSSAPPSSASIVPKSSRVPHSREVEQRPSSSQSAPRPKLAKTVAPPPMRRDGETLTSNFRGGVIARESKDKKPVAKAKDKPTADGSASKASSSKVKSAKEWKGEPDDIPLSMMMAKTGGNVKAVNGRVGVVSNGSSNSVAALAKARESAETPSSSKARDSLPGSGRKVAPASGSGPALGHPSVNGSTATTARPSVAASRKTTQESAGPKRKRPIDDGDDEYAPGSKKTVQKTTPDAVPPKRKRALDDGEDDYVGPGASKKRKSLAPPGVESHAAPTKLLNGAIKKEVVIKRSPRPSPPPPPAPPVTKLPNAHADRQLAKGLKFKKEERKPELLTPNTSTSSMSANASSTSAHAAAPSRPPLVTNGSSNGFRGRRRGTPTFTSDEAEGEDEEAEEGEVRPQKKNKTSHAAATKPKATRTWKPQAHLPSDHAALRARYSETYVEFKSCQHVLAMQRHLLNKQIESEDGEVDASETMDEAALEKFKVHHNLVVEELRTIRKLLDVDAA